MARTQRFVGGAAALIAVAVIASCTKSKEVSTEVAVDPMFQSYVSLGNSLTAGFQSAGINDSTQAEAYPVVFAAQAHTRFAVPQLAKPGCPPPIDNFNAQTHVGGDPPIPCSLRGNTTGVVNNVAVPGAAAIDPVSLTTANSNALTTFILGGQTQAARAAQANPTFVSMWIGNNDVLSAALSGVLVAIPGVSPGITSYKNFVAQYKADAAAMTGLSSVQGGVLFAVVDVTNVPLLFHSDLLFIPQIKGAFDAAAQTVTTIDASCANTATLIDFQLAAAIHAGTQASTVYCTPHPLAAPPSPLALQGDLYILDSVEIIHVKASVDSFNTYIHAKADSIGWAYVDVNPTLQAYIAGGFVPPFPDLAHPTATFGPYFSLDGVHATALSHVNIATLMIDSVNAKYSTSVPTP